MSITAVFWMSFAAALLVGGAAMIRLRDDWSRRLGMPLWDFSRSWASNVSVTAGAFTVAIFGYFAKDTVLQRPKLGYVVLAGAFALQATLAPLVYNVSRRIRETTGPGNTKSLVAEGQVWAFVLAGTFTLAASCGQLLLVIAILEELLAQQLPHSVVRPLQGLVLAVTGSLLWYGNRSMVETVRPHPTGADTKAETVKNSPSLHATELGTKGWTLL